MVTHATVLLWGKPVGLVVWDDRLHSAQFQYDRDFANGNLNVAPVMMPLSRARNGDEVFTFGNLRDETFKGLPGLLADCLPDRFGNTLLNAWLRSQDRAPCTESRGTPLLFGAPRHGGVRIRAFTRRVGSQQ